MGWIIAVAVAAVLAGVGGAEAGSRGFIVQDRGLEVFGERRITVTPIPHAGGRGHVQPNPNCFDHRGSYVCGGPRPHQYRHPHQPPAVVPHATYLAPGRNCYAPGYWSTQWVPQTTLYNAWVPGYWSRDGFWIEGHYEQRPWVSGYVAQNVWVPERWAC